MDKAVVQSEYYTAVKGWATAIGVNMGENLKNVDQGNKAGKEKYLEYDSII